MDEVGVKAVVENVAGFIRDMKRIGKMTENFAEQVFDLGGKLGSAGMEQFGLDILGAGSALASLNPIVLAVGYALGGFLQKTDRAGIDLKKVFVTAVNIAISVLRKLKDVLLTVVRIALTPFQKAWKAITGVLKRVFTIATGILTANTIRRLGQVISEAGRQALEAGVNFQVLETRLVGLAARQFLNAGGVEDFSDALDKAIPKSQELLDWVIKLSLTAPLSTDAIADTLTLATSYGLAENAAKDMTTAVLTFASGMGLTDLAQRRIIENFGQMIQQGKITSMELRDMGRGAFVPVNDLLNRTAELLGMNMEKFEGTAAEINKFAKKAGLDPTIAIMEAFVDLTEEEFPGAIERMGATIQGLRQRFSNLVNSIIGLNVLKPSLDLLGQTIGNVFDKIADSQNIDVFSQLIGERLADMVDTLLANMPSVEEIVDKIEQALVNVWTALRQIQSGDFMGAMATLGVPQGFLDFLQAVKDLNLIENAGNFISNILTALKNLKTWWSENGDVIMEALRIATGNILGAMGISLEGGPTQDELNRMTPGGMAEQQKPWYERILDMDAQAIADKIIQVSQPIADLVGFLYELPAAIEGALPYLALLGAGFFVLKHPILSILLLIAGIPFAIGAALSLAARTIAEKGPEWFQTSSELMHKFQEGFANVWNNKVIPWLQGVISGILNALGPVGDYLVSQGFGNMDALKVTVPAMKGGGDSTRITNNNINVRANYSQTQSPARISDDVSVLLSRVQ